MTKPKGPLFSLQARGKLGQAVTFRRSPTGTLAIAVAQVTDQHTAAQLQQRALFSSCALAWHGLSAQHREYYRQLNPRSNYNAAYINFMGVCLMPAYLDDLIDVELTAPADGEILVYDDATGLWKNQPAPISDLAYGVGWNGVVAVAPSKNTVYDKIQTHEGAPAAHHVKYTNPEAVAAMGAKGDANPLHHDKAAEWGAAEHTAIGNGAPHHVKYTNAQAVAAAKAGVKLNELQAPNAAVGLAGQVLDNIGAPVDAGDALRKGTRFGKDQFEWTAAKLLLGAGAGADPTEIDVPAGPTIASGAYTGDGTDGRQIAIGFKCSHVVLQPANMNREWILIPLQTIMHWHINPHHCQDRLNTYLHATDGFVVSKTTCGNYGPNENTLLYRYFAISE